MNPRKPIDAEKKELVDFLLRENAADEGEETIKGYVEDAYIAVFDDYVTGSPGYSGKVMVVVYDGGTTQTETYSWHSLDGKIQRDVAIYNA
jgi:hypothetical protein